MFDPSHLAALSAILRNGSFERAAHELGVTQSAVSQRIRLLEEQIGTPLVIRAQPCTATEAGQRVFRHAEELRLLEQELRTDLGMGREGDGEDVAGASRDARGWPAVRLAVNADSLATWFLPAVAQSGDLLFDLATGSSSKADPEAVGDQRWRHVARSRLDVVRADREPGCPDRDVARIRAAGVPVPTT